MKFLGILAILIFVIISIAPNIVLYKNKNFKDFKIQDTVIFILLNVIFVVMMVVNFIKGKNCIKNNKCIESLEDGEYNENVRLYKLFTDGGWRNFQYWYASIASNVWMDILITSLLFLWPFPFFPKTNEDKLILFLSKLGIYKISLAVVLGNPRYIVDKTYSGNMDKYEIAEASITVFLFILLICYTIYSKLKK